MPALPADPARRALQRPLRSGLLDGAHPHPILHRIARMYDDHRILREPVQNLGLVGIAKAGFHDTAAGSALLDGEDGPAFWGLEEGSGRDFQDVLFFPEHDAGFDPLAVAQAAGGIDEVGDDVDPLLFDAERRDFGEAGGLDGPYPRLQLFPTPGSRIEPHRRAGTDFHGVGRQHVDHHLARGGRRARSARRRRPPLFRTPGRRDESPGTCLEPRGGIRGRPLALAVAAPEPPRKGAACSQGSAKSLESGLPGLAMNGYSATLTRPANGV